MDRALLEWVGTAASDRERALDEVCAAHPDLEPIIRRRARYLLDAGLLDAEAPPMGSLERLGPFRLQHMIGGGGMGVVYLARQDHFDRPVAVKLLRPEFQLFERSRERFRREIAAVSRLQHPGIVPVYHCGEEQNVLYLAMEHVAGLTLAELLQALPRGSAERRRGSDVLAVMAKRTTVQPALRALCDGSWTDFCARIANAIGKALHHAHERGVIHRDVKPSNVILADDGRVMLMDFGLATASGASKLTASGAQPGSLPYMAPEQVRSEPADARTDVYGLGITLYELLTLTCPYWDEASEALRQQVLDASPVPVRQRNRAVSRDLETICHKAMDPVASHRYRSAAALVDDLTAALELRPITARPTSAWRRGARWCQRHPTTVVALAALLVVSAGVPLLVNLSLREQRDEALQQAYSAHVVAAAYYLSIHNALGAKQQLRECDADLRGFEWHHLERVADQSLAHLPDYRGYFSSVHWAGEMLVHADESTGTLSAVSPGEPEPRWRRALDTVRWADVSPDGRTVAVACGDAAIVRLDTATGTLLPAWTPEGFDAVRWLQFVPGGGLAIGSQTGDAALLDESGTVRSHASGLPPGMRAASPDGALAVASGLDVEPRAEIWNLQAGTRVAEVCAGRRVRCATFRGDGQHIAIGCEDGVIEIFDPTGMRIASMTGHAGRTVNSLRYRGDGTLLSVGNDCTLQEWDPEKGIPLETHFGHDAIVLDLDVRVTDERVATVSPFDGVHLWDLAAAPTPGVRFSLGSGAEGLAWSEDGGLLHVACQDGTCRTLDAPAGREITSFDSGARLFGCARDADFLYAVGVDRERALVRWDLKSGRPAHRLPVRGYHDVTLVVLPDGAVACGNADGSIRVFEPESGRERTRLGGPGSRVTALAVGRAGTLLAAGDGEGNLCLLDIASGERVAAAEARGKVLSLAVRNEELWCGEDNLVVVRALESLDTLRTLEGHQGRVHDLSVSPDGTRVASASHDGTVRVWHARRGDCLLVLTGSGNYVYSVAFDPTGQRLAGGCSDGSVYVW